MKPDKVLCCMLLFCFFGLDRAQNTIVVCSVPRNYKPIETCWLRNSCIAYDAKQRTVQGRGPWMKKAPVFRDHL